MKKIRIMYEFLTISRHYKYCGVFQMEKRKRNLTYQRVDLNRNQYHYFWLFTGLVLTGINTGLIVDNNMVASADISGNVTTKVSESSSVSTTTEATMESKSSDSSSATASESTEEYTASEADESTKTSRASVTSSSASAKTDTSSLKTVAKDNSASNSESSNESSVTATSISSSEVSQNNAADNVSSTSTGDDRQQTSAANSTMANNTADTASSIINSESESATAITRASTAVNSTTGTTNYDNASAITSSSKAVVANTTDKLASTYSFIPKFNGSGTTVVSVIGVSKDSISNNKVAVDLTTATKGASGFKYTNVGYDSAGNSIDLEIIYTNWGRLDASEAAYVETYKTKISTNIVGAGWVDVTYKFVYSNTENEASVSGLLTLTDIDGGQTVSVSDDQWANIDTVYVPQSSDPTTGTVDNWLRYVKNGDYITIVSPSENSSDNDEYAMITFTYTNQSSLSFRYSNGKSDNASVTNKWGVNYIAQKPLATATIAPTASVTDSDQVNVKANCLFDGETQYQYTFKQTIPDEWSQYYYQNVTFTGTLPGNVTLGSYTVVNEAGVDVTRYFSNQSNGQNIILSVNSDYLSNSLFYGHYYTIKLTVSVEQTNDIQILNMALITSIDNEDKMSNTVSTTVDSKHYLVTHYYVNGTTTKLAEDDITRVVYGTIYTTKSTQIIGYSLVNQSNTSGIFIDDSIDAIFEYEPVTITVPVIYVDQNGNTLVANSTISGKYGESYDASSLVSKIDHYTMTSIDNATGYYSFNNENIVIHYQADTVAMKVVYLGMSDGESKVLSEENYAAAYNDTISIAVKDYSAQNYYPDVDDVEVVAGTTSKVIIPYTYIESIVYSNIDGSISDFVLNTKGQWKLIEFMDINGNQVSLIAHNGVFKIAEAMDSKLADEENISEDDAETSAELTHTFKYSDGSQITYQLSGNIAVITSDSDVGNAHIHVAVSYDKYGREESYLSIVTTKSGKIMKTRASQTADGKLWVDSVTFGKSKDLITVFQPTGIKNKTYKVSIDGRILSVTQGTSQQYTMGTIQYTFKIIKGCLTIYETSDNKTTVYKLSKNWQLSNYDLLTMHVEKAKSNRKSALKTNNQFRSSNQASTKTKKNSYLTTSQGRNNAGNSFDFDFSFGKSLLSQKNNRLTPGSKTDVDKQMKHDSIDDAGKVEMFSGKLFVANRKKSGLNSVDKKAMLPQLSEPRINWLAVIGMTFLTGLTLFGGAKHEKHN
ncbi:MucBP domain-containing protein [Lactiplantibacillus plantarum]|uniref:MucBP domain-containing protein n=4 Tax=Lactiplantibacillus plantarum TaxID=1590 RepID=UPI0009B5167C